MFNEDVEKMIEEEINKLADEKFNKLKKEYEEEQLEKIVYYIYNKNEEKEVTEENNHHCCGESCCMNENCQQPTEEENNNYQNFDYNTSKCEFPNCPNYKDGNVDYVCKFCDNYIVKSKKDKERKDNLKDSAVNKRFNYDEYTSNNHYNESEEDEYDAIERKINHIFSNILNSFK